jgi:dimethylaniline monooxygenase (N-oxide forming)
VGAGMMGLVATKNLLEQGLGVTTYERNDYIGGNWHATLNTERTSALPITTMNTSRHMVREQAWGRVEACNC